jgi:quinoprotein glucose dehydrogenase
MRLKPLWLAVGVITAVQLTYAQPQPAPSSRKPWNDYGGGRDSGRYVPLTQITKDNVGRLRQVWTYPFGDTASSVWSPIVVDNMIYVVARGSSLIALDATTGKEIWVHAGLTGIAPRGIAYWENADRSDRRLLYQRNNFLEALDARTGLPILSFGTDGAVNLRDGFDWDPAAVGRAQASTPGRVFENVIIFGSVTGEGYLSTPGDLRAYDVVTGKEVWALPHDSAAGRVRLRHLAQGRVEVRGRRQHVG